MTEPMYIVKSVRVDATPDDKALFVASIKKVPARVYAETWTAERSEALHMTFEDAKAIKNLIMGKNIIGRVE